MMSYVCSYCVFRSSVCPFEKRWKKLMVIKEDSEEN